MESFAEPISRALRNVAIALPEVSEGDSCVNRKFTVKKKNFFFLGEKPDHLYMMFKLPLSGDRIREMADPRISIGSIGWATVKCPYDDVPDEAMLSDWVLESYRACAPKSVLKQLG